MPPAHRKRHTLTVQTRVTTEVADAGISRPVAGSLDTHALQNAIFNSANFSSIATDAKGVIQIFNVGAERMLGYAAGEVVNKITLDIMLPGMDGWELLACVHAIPSLQRIPIVVMSIVADRDKGFSLGAAAVLQKPVSRRELYDSLVELGLFPLSEV